MRVKYHGDADLSVGLMAASAARVLKSALSAASVEHANDALELWNTLTFIDADLVDTDVLDGLGGREKISSLIKSRIANFFTGITETSIFSSFNDLEYFYREDLVDAVVRYDVGARVSSDMVLNAMSSGGVAIGDMLSSYQFVRKFGQGLRSRLLSEPVLVEAAISSLVRGQSKSTFFPPREVSEEEWSALLLEYINGSDANLNYLRLVKTARARDIPGLNDEVRLAAIRRCDELEAELFSNRTGGYTVRYGLSFGEHYEERIEDASDGSLEISHTYPKGWLEDTLDFPSILNNLQALFEFSDDNVILTLPSYPSEIQGLEASLAFAGKTSYPRGTSFRAKETIALLQMHSYANFLSHHNIEIEDVYAWFFNEYLLENHGGLKISYRRSSSESTYLERIRHLLSEMEGVLRQFNLYAKFGEIDSNRLQYGSEDLVIEKLTSQVPDKYAEPVKGSHVRAVMDILFSDQSTLRYIDESKSDENFAALVLKQNICLDDLHDYQVPAVRWLREIGVLEPGVRDIKFRSLPQVSILSRLFRVGAVNIRWFDLNARRELLQMEALGWVARRRGLLTQEESRFFNFMLNDREFSDGPRLRNNYLHSRVPLDESGDREYSDYLRVLLLIAQIVIKINDDFRVVDLTSVDSEP